MRPHRHAGLWLLGFSLLVLTALTLQGAQSGAGQARLQAAPRTPLYLPYAVAAATPIATTTASVTPTTTAMPTATTTSTPTGTPTATRPAPAAGTAWTQHAHDAQRTSYTAQAVPLPWRWVWDWNGPDANGGIAPGKSRLPRNVQPVTGGGRVYVAAGAGGVYALDIASGVEEWHVTPAPVNSTPAYDAATNALFVVATDGRLYKLDAASGATLLQYDTSATSNLPLPPALVGNRVYFGMGSHLYALDTATLDEVWSYATGAAVETPPTYSSTRNRVIVATADLYVHAVDAANGQQAWRVRPVDASLAAGETDSGRDFAEYRYGWPVVADASGLVLVKARLDWDTLWTWNPWPISNATMRANLTGSPEEQALFVLDLDDGTRPFIANIGHGGYGDGGVMPMGPQPVVRSLASGGEVVYTVIRGSTYYDGRWDSAFGEMVLAAGTVPGYAPGEVRFIAYDLPPGSNQPYLLTDEQPNVSMAGDILFGGHWEAGFSLQILDRSPARGAFTDRITSTIGPTIVTSQDAVECVFSPNHYCANRLNNTRVYSPGFYIYYGQGAVYDPYWSGYSAWVVSEGKVFFRSTDGAIVALTSGEPEAAAAVVGAAAGVAATATAAVAPGVIDAADAARYAEQVVTVMGTVQYVFDNGKQTLVGFRRPHQGAFKFLVAQADRAAFPAPAAELYRVGQVVQVTGQIGWYQGDPVIRVTAPGQVQSGVPSDR